LKQSPSDPCIGQVSLKVVEAKVYNLKGK
jgi:hypothetical protein